MDQLLQVGICYEISVSKKCTEHLSTAKLESILAKRYTLDLYNYFENDDSYNWKIRNRVFLCGIKEFLLTQYKMFETQDEEIINLMLSIWNLKNPNEIIELSQEKRFKNFIHASQNVNIIDKLDTPSICAELNIISFFSTKVSDKDSNLITYLENLIKKNNTYKIAKSTIAFWEEQDKLPYKQLKRANLKI
jgi:hypothetical protein